MCRAERFAWRYQARLRETDGGQEEAEEAEPGEGEGEGGEDVGEIVDAEVEEGGGGEGAEEGGKGGGGEAMGTRAGFKAHPKEGEEAESDGGTHGMAAGKGEAGVKFKDPKGEMGRTWNREKDLKSGTNEDAADKAEGPNEEVAP
jgi:hypothetical protein